MRELFAGILGTYGQRVSCPESGKSWRAFVQPVRGQASQEERSLAEAVVREIDKLPKKLQ